MAEALGRADGEAVAAEDRFAPPETLRALVRIRRGGLLAVEPRAVDASAVAERAEALTIESFEAALLRLESRDPAYSIEPAATHVRNLLADSPAEGSTPGDGFITATWEMTVEMAAALITVRVERAVRPTPKDRRIAGEEVTALLDHWIGVRGIEFAAEALVRAVTAPLWQQPNRWSDGDIEALRGTLLPLRTRLAECADIEGVIAVLTRFRARNRQARVVTSYLLPAQHEWVAADIEEVVEAGQSDAQARLLVDAAHTPAQLRRLDTVFGYYWSPDGAPAIDSAASVMTVLDGVGFEALPVLAGWLEHPELPAALKAAVGQAIATIPTDAAFTALATRTDQPAARNAVRQAAEWFPRRALRLLDARSNAEILRELVHRHPDLAAELLPRLAAPTADVVAAELESVATATANDRHPDIPEILRTPPWQRKRPAPVVIDGLTAPGTVRCAWLPGERDSWLTAEEITHPDRFDMYLRRIRPEALDSWDLYVWLAAPESHVRPLLAVARMSHAWAGEERLRVLIARYETESYPLALDIARRAARDVGHVLAPFESAAAVSLAVQWLERRTLRAAAIGYLSRHAEFASRTLIPEALSKGTKARRTAGRALRMLAELGHGDAVRAAAVTYGAKVAAGVDAVLATDPVDVLPARIPALPAWVNIPALPPISAGSCNALPVDAVHSLLTMLLLSTPGEPYAGLDVVKHHCDTAELAEFTWAVYRQWWQAGAPTKHYWVYEAMGALGDDTVVERLLADVREMRSDPRSVPALDTFVTIGSNAALLALKTISEKVKTARVREGALERITDIADRMGLTPDQLADRLVPDLGLRADGTAELDFGPRRFVIGFDEQLRPTLTTSDGKTIKTLPKAGAKDNAELAEQAHKTFRGMKKDARALAADQLARLERAMVTRRRFSVTELRELFIAHPLRWHITRRIVWGVYMDDALVSTFRIAEDRSFADHADDALTLAEDAVLGVAHPLEFPDRIGSWAEIFADYELLQPFPQLARELFTVPEELGSATEIRGDGTKVDGTRFLGLTGRGWPHPGTGDGGYLYDFEKPLPGGHILQITAEPGIATWDPQGAQTFDARLHRTRQRRGDLTFAELDPITASELLRDIAWLNQPTG
ncbi:DUF4132 domain-containing protein [Nocardia sp. NPDC052001]|uniref:DUF4132 domain-containing protein n=1 Tax=Nocardia sp. NPDC052001 TaxID=3154853 RepID=UPI0034186083